jgi:sortase B
MSAAMFLWFAHGVVTHLLAYDAATREYENLASVYTEKRPSADGTSPVDFAALRRINPHIVGWLRVSGTNIDYPVVRGEDNETYLNTTFSGERNVSGAVFMDFRNAPDFSDAHTLIYAHRMRNGAMFSDLARYREQDFYDSFPVFALYTPEAIYRCEVFSAYITPADSKTYYINFPEPNDFADWLAYTKDESEIRADTSVLETDRILTLSTCDYRFEDARIVVHAKLVRLDAEANRRGPFEWDGK